MKLECIQQYKALPRDIYVLFVARTIAAMGAFVYPFLTLFMSNILGYSEQVIGSYLFATSLLFMPAIFIGGKLGDIFPRKKTYVVLMGTSLVIFLIAGFFIDKSYIIYFFIIGFFFNNAASPVITAMMMDRTTNENRQVCFSLIYLGFNMGYAIGPLVAGFLFANYLPWIFWGNGIIGLIAITIIMFNIKEVELEKKTDEKKENFLRLLLKDKVLLTVALLCSVFAFAYSQTAYMLPLEMEEAFGIELGSKYYGGVSSLNGVFVFILTPVVIAIFKKRTTVYNIAIAGFIYCIGFGGLFYSSNVIYIYTMVFVFTTGEVLLSTNTGVLIANHAPLEYRARYQSIYEIIQGLGRAFGPFVMGYFLIDHTIPQGWLLVGAMCMVSAIILMFMRKNR